MRYHATFLKFGLCIDIEECSIDSSNESIIADELNMIITQLSSINYYKEYHKETGNCYLLSSF